MSDKQLTYPTVYDDARDTLEPKIKVLQIVIDKTLQDRLRRHVQSFRRRIESVKDAVIYTINQLTAAERLVDDVSELEKVDTLPNIFTYKVDIRNWQQPFRVDVSYVPENGKETVRSLKLRYKRNEYSVIEVDVINVSDGTAGTTVVDRIDALEKQIDSIVPGSTRVKAINGIFRELDSLSKEASRSENITGMLVKYAEDWMGSRVDDNYGRFLYNDPAIA